MPRRRRRDTFTAHGPVGRSVGRAVRGAVAFRLHAERSREASAVPLPTRADMGGLPPELRSVLGTTPDPSSILRSAGALPGLGVIKRLTGRSDNPASAGAAPFADVGTP